MKGKKSLCEREINQKLSSKIIQKLIICCNYLVHQTVHL